MQVILAKSAGFCKGVRRAIDITLDAAQREDGPIFTHGPLIHNPQAIQLLEKKGVKPVDNIEGIDKGTLVIRAHGIPPKERDKIKNSSLRMCDATCPDVARVQGIVRKHARNGFHIIIIGDRGHAEVLGLEGYAEGRGFVLESMEQIKELPPAEKICVVAQTTQDRKNFQKICKVLKSKYQECLIFDTICDSTENRQKEVRELSQQVDVMVIVGGHNSANTNRLVEIAKEYPIPVYHIETDDDISSLEMSKYQKAGVTAGASTPQWIIQKVVQKLESMEVPEKNWLIKITNRIFGYIIKSNIWVALGASCLVYASCVLQNIPVSIFPVLIAFFSILSLHILHRFLSLPSGEYNDPATSKFYQRYEHHLKIMALGGSGLALILSIFAGKIPLLLIMGALVFGSIYSGKYLRNIVWLDRVVRISRDFPISKDLTMSFAWIVIIVVVSRLSVTTAINHSFWITCLYIGSLVFIRSVLCDIRDIEGDRIIGRETLPIMIGKAKTKIVLLLLTLLVALGLVIAILLGWVSDIGYWYLLPIVYVLFYLFLYHKRIIYSGVVFEFIVDSSYILPALCAWIATQ